MVELGDMTLAEAEAYRKRLVAVSDHPYRERAYAILDGEDNGAKIEALLALAEELREIAADNSFCHPCDLRTKGHSCAMTRATEILGERVRWSPFRD